MYIHICICQVCNEHTHSEHLDADQVQLLSFPFLSGPGRTCAHEALVFSSGLPFHLRWEACLTASVYKVVLQKSIPARIRQLIIYYY